MTDMTFRNLSYHRMFSNRQKKGKYDMIFEIYFSFQKNTFRDRIKLTKYQVKIFKKTVAIFAFLLDLILFRKIISFFFQPYIFKIGPEIYEKL